MQHIVVLQYVMQHDVLLFSDFERDVDCDFDMVWSGLGDFDAYFECDSV